MTLKEIGDLIILNAGTRFKARKFNHNRFDPDHAFKSLEKLELSYSTQNQFKECMLKFCARKFIDLGFFKTNEALFLGNMVHKFIEDLINEYSEGNLPFNQYNDIARSHYESIYNMFDKNAYATEEMMVETLFKYVMGRKKFEPDIFFDDISFLSDVFRKRNNYVNTKKSYFQNAAKLLKQLFSIADRINATNFKVEDWFKFTIEGIPVTFTGKIDLYFPYIINEKQHIGIVDFKTGKKEYFSWDQLNYYSLYFGEDKFNQIEKHFFDIREGNIIVYKNATTYNDVYSHLKNSCEKIYEVYLLFNDSCDELKVKYTKKLNSVLRKVKPDEVHKIPCELTMSMLDILNTDFFKAKGITNYHSNGGFACTYCDILSYCPIRS